MKSFAYALIAIALLLPFIGTSVVFVSSAQPSGDDRAVIDGPIHDGQQITVDLDPHEQFKNIGSKIDGAGMCVFSSIEMAARAQGLEKMRGWRDWCAANFSGGGWPGRVDDYLAKWWAHKKIDPIPYYQYEGSDPEPVLEVIDKTGRMACFTYGYGERYVGPGNPSGHISHMVCGPCYRSKKAAVLDNNFPATPEHETYEWMDAAELVRRMKLTGGKAWIFCWLPPPPPPPVRNAR